MTSSPETTAPPHNLRDVTFIIPIFLDTPERARNLQQNIAFLGALFHTQIFIAEALRPGHAPLSARREYSHGGAQVRYFPLDTQQSPANFHRTRILNFLLAKVETPFVCNLDCDIIFPARQYLIAAQLLRWNVAPFVLPYDGATVHIPQAMQDAALALLKNGPLAAQDTARVAEFVWSGQSKGGAIFAACEIYRVCGGENEHFIGWGWEDFERLARFEKLGHRVARAPGCLYHLSHPRGSTSSEQHENYNANRREWQRIESLPRPQLEAEISRWNWPR